jgi:hypothetical protein
MLVLEVLFNVWTASSQATALSDIPSDSGAGYTNRSIRGRNKGNDLRRLAPVVEAVGGIFISVAIHLRFPREILTGSGLVLVAFHMVKRQFKREKVKYLEDSTLQIRFRSKAVVQIGPRLMHRGVDAIDESHHIVTVE